MSGKSCALLLCLQLGTVASVVIGCVHQATAPPKPPSPSPPPFIAYPQKLVLNGDEVHVPFDLEGFIPVLKFTLPDGTRARMVLDTGAGCVVITPELAASMHLTTRPSPAGSYRDAGGTFTPTGIASVRQIQIRAARFENFDAAMARLPYLDALLGWPLFYGTLLTIDYSGRQIVLKRGSLPEPDGQRILPLRIDNGEVFAKATLAGRETWLELDTGCGLGAVALTRATSANVSWVSPLATTTGSAASGSYTLKLGRLQGDLTLGRYRFVQPLAAVGDAFPCDMLGADALANFTVTLDLHNLRARFERQPDNATEFRFGPFLDCGFGCDLRSQPVKVISVLPGGDAEHAGLRAGDLLLTVDGRPAAEGLSNHGGQDPYVVELQRGDGKMKLSFPPTKLVP